jgi:plastocyanin
MKTALVRVSDNYDLETAKSDILERFGYLTFDKMFPSFKMITFTCDDQYQLLTETSVRALPYIQRFRWDAEDKFSLHPVEDGATATIETNGEFSLNSEGGLNAVTNTRNLTGSGSGTLYVKVQNIGGLNFYVFSQTQGGTYSRYSSFSGFVQGATYTFDTSDVSNATHPFRLSETPDGTWTTGGTEYTTGVTVNGTAGSAGSYTRIVVGTSTPSVFYYYCTNHPGMGRYQVSPDRFGTFNIHDYWHLDRITKQDRQYLNGEFSTTVDGDTVDIYVIDTGVRGASRPTGNNAALHPELFDPNFVSDLNGTSEQQNYRVFEVAGYTSPYSTNEDDNGHGTYCAICSAGRTAGVAREAKIYALKAFSSTLSASYTAILDAYQKVLDHNTSGNANYKGNTRAAVINASFGPTIPSQNYPYVELNDAGNDSGTDEEMLDDMESTLVAANIMLVRSAGNGFKNSSDAFAGPLMGKVVAGTRTAGYADATSTGQINNVDVNQNKISVGASTYNDRWADFSNYGSGVTTVAPGSGILVPQYDWTTNTPYNSTSNYTTINGTSFSGPIVTGIIAAWADSNGYTLTTNTLTALSKSFIRGTGSTGDITKGAHVNYPTNSIVDKKLPTDPFAVTASSDLVVMSFNSADSSYFLNNVGQQLQLRTSSGLTSLVLGGVSATTFNITVTAPSASAYNLSGTDRSGNIAGNNVAVTCNVGDTLNFNLSGVSVTHPFYLRDSNGGPNVSTPAATGQGSTGTATVSWTPNTSGTYYYQCGIHSVMIGSITVTNTGSGIDIVSESQEGWFTIQAQNAVNNTLTIRTSGATPSSTTTGGGANNYAAIIKSADKSHEAQDGVVATGVTLRSQTDTQEGQGTGSYTNVKYIPVDTGVDFEPTSTADNITKSLGAFYPFIDTTITWATAAGTIGGSGYNSGDTVNIDLGASVLRTFSNEPVFENYVLSGDSIGASGLTFNTSTGILSGTVTADYLDTTFNITVTEQTTQNARSYSFTTLGTGVLVTITNQPTAASVEAGSGGTATFGPVAGTSSDGSTITYQWQVSQDNSAWSNVTNTGGYSGATTATLTVDDDFAKNAYYFRCELDTNTAVSPSYTNSVQLTVFRVITISTQPTDQQPVAPAAATFTTAASTLDSASVSYQWQKQEAGTSTWSDIGGATTISYTTGTTSYDADFGDSYRCRLNATGATQTFTNAALLNVTRTINITSQPTSTTGAIGGTRTFGVAGNTSDNDAGDITYQWQRSITQGSSWSDINGATASSYTTPALDSAYDNNQFRCLLSAPGATTVPSNAATLQVETVTPIVTIQPSDATVDEGTTATFTTLGDTTMTPIGGNAASSSFDTESFTTPSGGGGDSDEQFAGGFSDHAPSVTYQWQKSDDAGANWTDVPGATNASYTTGTLTYASDNQDQYRCEIDASGAVNPAYTNAVTLTVERTLSIQTDPANQTGNEGSTSTYNVTTTQSSGTPTYQWERSDDGGANYGQISGATSASYTTPTLVYADDNNDRYRVVVSLVGAASSVTSNYATQTVLRVINITTQPQDIAVIEGATATFNIAATITSDSITYQWQISTNGGGAWSNINGANGASYTTPATTYPTTPSEQFRCVLTNPAATTVTSSAATLTVNESEFVSAPSQVTPFVDPDTNRTLSRQPVITTSAFVSEYAGSTHFSSFWRIRRTADNVTVYDTAATFAQGDTGNKTSFTVSGGILDFDTAYYVQVKFRDNNGLESAYSTQANFTTPFVDQPNIQTITPAFNPTVNVDAAQIKSGYVHTSSDWQFSPNSAFSSIVHQSLGNTANLTSYTLPNSVNLTADTTYYVRIRFNVNPQ